MLLLHLQSALTYWHCTDTWGTLHPAPSIHSWRAVPSKASNLLTMDLQSSATCASMQRPCTSPFRRRGMLPLLMPLVWKCTLICGDPHPLLVLEGANTMSPSLMITHVTPVLRSSAPKTRCSMHTKLMQHGHTLSTGCGSSSYALTRVGNSQALISWHSCRGKALSTSSQCMTPLSRMVWLKPSTVDLLSTCMCCYTSLVTGVYSDMLDSQRL